MGHAERPPTQTLPESASVLLDLARLTAALLVVIAHMTHPEFHLGNRDRQVLGDIAVPVFFVLSGFVIRYVTLTRESTAREYFIDRASRIYSVVVPAMVFTLSVAGTCFLLNRQEFINNWSATCNHPVQRLVLNLVFFSQAWGHNTIPFINPPFWSLGYECIYYLFYGFLFFFRGWKRVLFCLVLAGAIGPQVLLLFPVWWLGCWTYDVYAWCRGGRTTRFMLAVGVGCLAIGVGLSIAGYGGLIKSLSVVFWWIAGLPNPMGLLGMLPMRATMFAVATGVSSSAILLALLLLVDPLQIPRSNRWAVGFRQIANGTFTIYLGHYPFLVLLLFAGALRPRHTVENVLLGVLMCAVLIGLVIPVDRLKQTMRMWFQEVVPGDV